LIKITPLARKMALEAGIDLAKIRGTGVGGCVTKNDVHLAISEARLLQRRTSEVADEFALLSSTVNATEFLNLLDSLQTLWDDRRNQSLKKSGLLMYIVAYALAGIPEFRGSKHDNLDVPLKLALFHQETKDIQVYDVKKEQISLPDITDRMARKSEAAINDKHWDACSVMITDLTEYRVDWFVPTLFAPFAVSVGFAGIMPRPFYCDSQVCLLHTLPVILRFNPQFIDYWLAGRALTRIVELFEQPFRLLSY